MLTLLALLAQTASALPVVADTTPVYTVTPRWTPHRIYDTRAHAFTDLEAVAHELAQADVVMFGEQHDDPGTHAMERAVLEAVGRRRTNVVLALEMFERDVQPTVDGYLAGRLPEDSLLANARPWPNYATDYRPLVEWARHEHWPVIAGNVPRVIASAVAKDGWAAILEPTPDQHRQIARMIECRYDEYFERFAEAMRDHVPGDDPESKAAALKRYYQAQCVKDETMAESAVRAWRTAGDDALVIHMNGSFHSDYHLGTAAMISSRLPEATVLVISAIPVADLDQIDVTPEDAGRADFLIYTLAPAP